MVDGHTVRVGSLKYMQESGVCIPASLPAPGPVIPNYVSLDDRLLAMLGAMDHPR